MKQVQEINKRKHSESEMKSAINLMDRLSQCGFSEIQAIANLALSYLETPHGYKNLENIALALNAIADKAEDIQNQINCEAENIGCNYIDDRLTRRINARHTRPN